MNDNELNNIQDPVKRRLAIQDYLESRNLTHIPPSNIITPEQILARTAMGIWDSIVRNVARPMLKAMKQPSDYNPAGTQRLLMDSFKHKFSNLSKDELVMLVSIMHTEELEKQCAQTANAGLVGEYSDKKI